MATFLNTSATTYELEKLIKGAKGQLILISPYLKLNTRIKELLEDMNRLKLDVRIVYGKGDLQPEVINWLKDLKFVRTSFLENLHAKCYLNEEFCIITSMNLYEFSQVNNNEMGVLISRADDPELYRDAFAEVQRIIRIADEIRISLEKVEKEQEAEAEAEAEAAEATEKSHDKLTTSKLAAKIGVKTGELMDKLVAQGYLELREEKPYLTAKGKEAGGEFRMSQRYGPYFLWPEAFVP